MSRMLYLFPKERAGVTYPYVYWDDLFTEEELEKVFEYCETLKKEESYTVGKDGVSDLNNPARKSTVAWGNPNPENQWIFDRLLFVADQLNRRFYEFDLNGFESFQYTIYEGKEGEEPGKYDYHMDTVLGLDKPIEMAETRKLSLSLILSDPDDYEGGDFYIQTGSPDPEKLIKMEQKKGRVLAFPSFMIHGVAPVTKGTRRSIVVWVDGPKFK
jgi:PKHD-type hydroxylase